jgi:hypothetical protein
MNDLQVIAGANWCDVPAATWTQTDNEKIVAFVTLEETIISNMVGVTPAGNEKDFSYLNMIDNSVPIPAGVYIRPMFPLVELTVDNQVMAYYE